MPLYKMTSPEGKSYIGITTGKLINRMHRHRAAANGGSPYAIHAALRKYGFKAFTVEVLSDETDIKLLNELEVVAIAEHATLAPAGYNLTTGGDGVCGPHSAKRTREMWVNLSPEKRAAMIAKQGDASRAFWENVSDEERAVMQERGRKAAKEWWVNATPEQIAQSRGRATKKLLSRPAEFRDKIAKRCSEAASAHWANQTDVERAAHAIVRSKATVRTWANLTDEQRAERGRKMSEGRAAAKAKRLINAGA